MKQKFHFFWKCKILSQWGQSPITIGNHTFSCAEQAMMYGKAKLFDDHTQMDNIMATTIPHEHQSFGRLVNGYREDIWVRFREQIVYTVSYYKFTQNKSMMDYLLGIDCEKFVEASPVDPVWGIKLNAISLLAQNEQTWQGLNLLGKILTAVRDGEQQGTHDIELIDQITNFFGA